MSATNSEPAARRRQSRDRDVIGDEGGSTERPTQARGRPRETIGLDVARHPRASEPEADAPVRVSWGSKLSHHCRMQRIAADIQRGARDLVTDRLGSTQIHLCLRPIVDVVAKAKRERYCRWIVFHFGQSLR